MSCPDCVKGYVHTGTPTGTEIKVGGVAAYAVGTEDAARVIIIGADIFGWKFVNTRLLADEYAARGFRVIVPDLFNGAYAARAPSPPLRSDLRSRLVCAVQARSSPSGLLSRTTP